MSFEVDEEILQDFLVEAGEILEQLSEQLVDLEQNPDDIALLNAIFRGFHTVKGGAGFLQLNALVNCCHYAENVFDILRNGQRSVTAELMDVVLQALDAVNEMFEVVRAGGEPEPADPEIINALSKYACPATEDEEAETEVEIEDVVDEEPEEQVEEVNSTTEDENVDISDDEFESLLNALGDDEAAPAKVQPEASQSDSAAPAGGDDITESEFDALLDQLHGEGVPGATDDAAPEPEPVKETQATDASSDEITEDEFEKLLNQLHGGGAPGQDAAKESEKPKAEKVASAAAGPDSDLITEDEFESLLDTLQAEKQQAPETPVPESKPKEEAKAKPKPKTEAKTKPKAEAKPKPKKAEVVAKDPAKAKDDKPNAPVVQETTVRVDTKRLDDIMNMVGELVLVRNRLVRLGLQSEDESMGKAVANLDVVTGDLQNAVMKTRMQPIKKVFGRFPRVVRDLARNLKKEVNLELRGEETDLDKNLVEALADPLVHLVRNSVDHGVEAPDIREANGKPRGGKVILSAEQEGDHILLSIEDDGAGMDADKLRQKAVEKGLMDTDAAERLSDDEAFNLIFAPGFSTKVEITDVSGRGVGMDVVKTKISQLNGTLDIKSVLGKGSRFSIKVPLTLAIMPTLMVMLEDQAFAFPLVSVNEIFHLNLKKTNIVDGQQVVVIRGKTLPIFHLKHWLVKGQAADLNPEEAHVVVVQVGMNEVGFVVDQLVGQEEVVIKPLGKMLQGTSGMAGATITGDGRIALILDVPSMLKSYASR
ncbi:chemotaxis protein CheW [Marinomonas sp. PE14-40]|uniref:chemotaxis protein CheA n=1 Tax=Marinomonas sp. PE14-40 TaxID=3060621 RepID=UPI003F67F0B4